MASDIPQSTIDELRQYAEYSPNWNYEHISRSRKSTWIFCDKLTPSGFLWTKRRVALGDIDEEDCEAICKVMNNLHALLTALESAQANERRYLKLVENAFHPIYSERWCVHKSLPAADDIHAAIDALESATGGENE